MKRSLAVLALGLVLLAALLVLRAVRLPSRQPAPEPALPVALDEQAAAQRLAEALRFETISYQERERFPIAAFEAFQSWLAVRFPGMHARLSLERVAEHALLYSWRGSDSSLAPVLLLAHQDVVPTPGVERWTHPPFAGVIADGFVWGRGAVDDKGSLVAICEAVEVLIQEGFAPVRTVYLAFGHDEEVGGQVGATRTAERLEALGARPVFVLDEGLAVLRNALPGVEAPLALVGVAEKGYATVELQVEAEGGHSSIPPPHTAVGILAAAVYRLERAPMPGGIRGVTRDLFAYLAPEMPLLQRIPLANTWLFGGLLSRALSRSQTVNAMLRTTTAVTMIEGSDKENVLPSVARAAVNFRILPGDTSEDVYQHVRRSVDDPEVALRFLRPPREPSAISPTDNGAWSLLQRTIASSFAGAVVAPGLTVGGTDARHYGEVSDALYRFIPFSFDAVDLGRIHGIDERIDVGVYADGIRFYVRLLREAGGSAGELR